MEKKHTKKNEKEANQLNKIKNQKKNAGIISIIGGCYFRRHGWAGGGFPSIGIGGAPDHVTIASAAPGSLHRRCSALIGCSPDHVIREGAR